MNFDESEKRIIKPKKRRQENKNEKKFEWNERWR